MPGYFGTPDQQRLQAVAEANAAFIAVTPGACQTGRMLGCDDLDRFGWAQIDAVLARDGVIGFRLIAADRAPELRKNLALRGFRLDTWDVYLADRDAVLAATAPILARGLPAGFVALPSPEAAGLQSLMSSAGIVPFSSSMLVGEFGPAVTLAIGDAAGRAVAAGHAYLPHNATSPRQGCAWGGLVAVAEAERGKGLGAQINARIAEAAFSRLGATHLYELISPTNVPSQRMAAACGLRHDPGLLCGVASRIDAGRFTR
jgi:hypothetical protein